MKIFIAALSISLFLSFNILTVPSFAQPKSLKQGIYKIKDIDLSTNAPHYIQNNSPNEYAYIIISDTNQLNYQAIQLEPSSDRYTFQPLDPEYMLIIVGKGEVTIS